jgi:3-hydroxyacyl-[acyl-carrier-protein] dehydratase
VRYPAFFNFDNRLRSGANEGMDILAAIPHRPPFLFVDKVIFCDETRIVTERIWDPSCDFYKGHYPNNPITPGVLICESVFQSAAILLADRMKKASGGAASNKVPVLTRIQNAKFKRMILPGQKAEIEVTLTESVMSAQFLTGKVTVDGKPAMTVDFAITMAERTPAAE